MAPRAPLIGHPSGVPVGTLYDTRADLHAADVHRETQAGICGHPDTGAESIVLAGGYVDDRDAGDRILYTGAGGRDTKTGRQTAHQSFGGTRAANWNRALAVSADNGRPVRVVRGHQARPHGPPAGYRYDGLWQVLRYWPEAGADGWRVIVFEMVPRDDSAITGRADARTATIAGFAEDDQAPFGAPPERVERSAAVPLRDPLLALAVKRLHDYCCQACGARVETAAGPYAEAAHIRPLGSPMTGRTRSRTCCACARPAMPRSIAVAGWWMARGWPSGWMARGVHCAPCAATPSSWSIWPTTARCGACAERPLECELLGM